MAMKKQRIRLLLLLVVCCCSCRWARGYSSPSHHPAMPTCAAGSGMPVVLTEPLGFCGNVGLSCCDSAADVELSEEFHAMNVTGSDADCARNLLCARCIPSSSASPHAEAVINAATVRSWCTSPAPTPQKHKAATSSRMLQAASILGSTTSMPFAIYYIYSLMYGGRGEEQSSAAAATAATTTSYSFTWTCCFFGNRDDGATISAPASGQGGTGATVELAEIV